MIRIEEMSVRLGIKSRAQGLAHACYAPPGQICRLSRPFRDGVEAAQPGVSRVGEAPQGQPRKTRKGHARPSVDPLPSRVQRLSRFSNHERHKNHESALRLKL